MVFPQAVVAVLLALLAQTSAHYDPEREYKLREAQVACATPGHALGLAPAAYAGLGYSSYAAGGAVSAYSATGAVSSYSASPAVSSVSVGPSYSSYSAGPAVAAYSATPAVAAYSATPAVSVTKAYLPPAPAIKVRDSSDDARTKALSSFVKKN